MSNKLRFTKDNLTNLPAVSKRTRFYDEKLNGLILEMSPSGVKTFRVYKRIKGSASPTNVTIGRFPDITIEQARKKATEELAKIAGGINPNRLRKVEHHSKKTFLEVYDDYKKSKSLSKKTLVGYDQAISCYLADWHKIRLLEIDEEMVKVRHKEISKRSHAQADLTMRIVRALFNFAKGEYRNAEKKAVFLENPVSILSHRKLWNHVGRRQTRLAQSSLKLWFQTLENFRKSHDSFMMAVCDFLELALLTGLRREELLSLQWDKVDMKNRTYHISKTKNGTALDLPIGDYAFTIFQRRKKLTSNNFVFQANNEHGYIREPKKSIAKIVEASGLAFTIQDLRRTFITIATPLNLGVYSLKRLMNHKTRRDDVTEGYIILTPEELREPTQKVEDAILEKAGVKKINAIKPTEISNISDIKKLSNDEKNQLLAKLLQV